MAILRDAMNADSADDPLTPGYKAGRLSVVTDQRLDTDSLVKWYACADPRRHDGIQVVTLTGSRGMPLLERKAGWISDAIEWKLTAAVAVTAVDFRSWFRLCAG
jgi:hypothetical protein